MNQKESEVLGIHAVALDVAAELLAESSDKATKDHWLTLIMAKAFTRCREMSPQDLIVILEGVGRTVGISVLPPEPPTDAEGDRLPKMNQDDPNRPGVGDQI